jgi:hypothetical protein
MSKTDTYFSLMAFALLLLAAVVSMSLGPVTVETYAQTVDNTTQGSQSSSPFEAESPAINEIFTRSGILSSYPRQLPGEDPQGQTAIILTPREDDAMYSGMLDYLTNRPVDVIAWNVIRPANDTAIPEEFGDLDDYNFSGNETVVFATLGSGTSGSVPFNANAIELVTTDGGNSDEVDDQDAGEPFIASYSLRAYPAPVEIVNNLSSLASFNPTNSE